MHKIGRKTPIISAITHTHEEKLMNNLLHKDNPLEKSGTNA